MAPRLLVVVPGLYDADTHPDHPKCQINTKYYLDAFNTKA